MFYVNPTAQIEIDILKQNFLDMSDDDKFEEFKILYEDNKVLTLNNQSLSDRVVDKQFIIDTLLKVVKYQNGLND